jgi:hypothetical protein
LEALPLAVLSTAACGLRAGEEGLVLERLLHEGIDVLLKG